MTLAKPKPMTADAFIGWAMEQPRGRFELDRGEIVAMAPERVRHALIKHAAAKELERAVAAAKRDCLVLPDGVTVVIDAATAFEPDAVVQCGGRIDPDAVTVERPMIVVEVTSPSSSRIDAGMKLHAYFRLPSLRHYLIVDATRRLTSWIRRAGAEGDALATWAGRGTIRLDPPGIDVDTDAFFASLPADAPDPSDGPSDGPSAGS